MSGQLAFDLPRREAFGAEDFFVSDANRAAYEMVDGARWPEGKLALIGPASSGKSHLAAMFAVRHGAEVAQAETLGAREAMPRARALVVEDMERIGGAEAQDWLFHAHNHLQREGGLLLLTADRPAPDWPIAQPDLMSRMQAAARVALDPPDDALLFAVLSKLFADRQLSPKPETVAYLAARMERSLAMAARVVAEMDAAALAAHREVNRGLAAEVLDKIDAGQS